MKIVVNNIAKKSWGKMQRKFSQDIFLRSKTTGSTDGGNDHRNPVV